MVSKDDIYYMQRALQLAAQGLGKTSPNPLVGAVIVKDDQIVGEGYHKKAGTPHAEVHALNAAGDKARGATIYVTLEPCSHFGKTPPCADALIKAQVARVVIATLDPNPCVAGRGWQKLKAAGIVTEVGVLEEQAQRQNEVFFHYITTGKPFVSLKVAMTLDGRIATKSGSSRWITGEESRYYVHHLRNINQAIMVGIGTVLADDPLLNTRLEGEDTRDPVRIIIDGHLNIPLESQIVSTSRNQRTIIFTSPNTSREKIERLENYGVEVVVTGGSPQSLDLEEIMGYLGQKGITSVLLEGGSTLNGAMLERGLINKLYWFIAPKMVGGSHAPGPVGGAGVELMSQALVLKDSQLTRLGEDYLITAYTGW